MMDSNDKKVTGCLERCSLLSEVRSQKKRRMNETEDLLQNAQAYL